MSLPAKESEIHIDAQTDAQGATAKGSAERTTNASFERYLVGTLVGLLLINTITLIVFTVTFNVAMSNLQTELVDAKAGMGEQLASSAMLSGLGLTANAAGESNDAGLSQSMMRMALGSTEDIDEIGTAVQFGEFAVTMGLLSNESIFELISNILKALDPGSLCKKSMSWTDAIFDAANESSLFRELHEPYKEDLVPILKECANVKPYLSTEARNSLKSPLAKMVIQMQNWLERNFEPKHALHFVSVVLHYLNEMKWLFSEMLDWQILYQIFKFDKVVA